MQEGGYKNISTGNASKIASESSLLYNKSLSSGMVDSLISIIKNDHSDIQAQESTESGEFDIVITTGSGQ